MFQSAGHNRKRVIDHHPTEGIKMTELAALLDHQTQTELRRVLTESRHTAIMPMGDEALAALAILGKQPEGVRRATLTIMPLWIRQDLDTFGLAERQDVTSPGWKLTSEGSEVASLLASSLPQPGPGDAQRAKAALQEILAKVQDELGPPPE
jgi:hypothetical protein